MELPNQNAPLLFSQMLQMFPNIPHDVILLYTFQYSNDVEKCIQMLKIQSGKYVNSGGNDLILNFPANQQLSSLNMKPNQFTDSFDDETNFNISFQSSNSPQLNVFNNNVETEDVIQSPVSNVVPNLEQNSNENSSEDCLQEKELTPSVGSSSVQPAYSLPIPDDKNSVPISQRIFENGVLNLPPSYLEASPALHVNVEGEEESNHSWRPNMTSDGLYSDFFLSSPGFDNTNNFDVMKHSPKFQPNSGLDQIYSSAFPVRSLSNPFNSSSSNYSYKDNSAVSHDVLNILNFQRIQFNVMRYEIMKSRTELDNLKEEVEKLSMELQEKRHSRETFNIKELNKENSELRLECQCLCLEVDYYLKGQAVLGETDENTYQKKEPPNEQAVCDHQSYSNGDDFFDQADELDELNKWECTKCTFANHPAINTCEMCQMPRPNANRTVFASSVPETCYCHSSNESPPISS